MVIEKAASETLDRFGTTSLAMFVSKLTDKVWYGSTGICKSLG